VRMSDRYRAGLSTDLAIEQVLMCLLKSRGGLTWPGIVRECQTVLELHHASMCCCSLTHGHELAVQDIHVNIPTFLKKSNRFHPKALSRDRKIASERVHIERHIGLRRRVSGASLFDA